MSTGAAATATTTAVNGVNGETGLNGDAATLKRTTLNNDVIVQSSSTSSEEKIITSSATNGNHQEEIVTTHISSSSSTLKTDSNASQFQPSDELQILGQLKNIEKINEKRRMFLQNTVNESSVEEVNGKAVVNEKRSYSREIEQEQQNGEIVKSVDKETSFGELGGVQLRSPPTSPPPKPPLSNRPSLSSPPPTPSMGNKVFVSEKETPAPQHVEKPPISPVRITSTMVPEPTRVTTVKLQEENRPTLVRQITLNKPATNGETNGEEVAKTVSTNHYDRLIEELKCPGCASPMRGPILLCESGHSVCEQCTRILMICPLCKEAFTKLRSRTVEALCSKAHFRCTHAANGCSVRLQVDLLEWHQKQCIYKPMKCFMGRVWGDCTWSGREIDWKEHLEREHGNKVFRTETIDLIWNMGIKQKPLTGYYVFQAFDEMFNFYEIYDKDRVLFTMACTSTLRDRKNNFAFEVTMIHQDNEALAITQKYPVHSEYDKDILGEGTCVSISLGDLSKFIDEDRLLHYRVKIVQIKPPRRSKAVRHSAVVNGGDHSINLQNTQIQGGNLKSVPADVIVTRKPQDDANADNVSEPSNCSMAPTTSSEDEVLRVGRKYNKKIADDSGSESDPEIEAFVNKRWGTPQMHFNRKFLKPASDASNASTDDSHLAFRNHDTLGDLDGKYMVADEVSIASTSYKKRMTNTLRKSFRSIKGEFIELKPAFMKKNGGRKNAAPKVPNGKGE